VPWAGRPLLRGGALLRGPPVQRRWLERKRLRRRGEWLCRRRPAKCGRHSLPGMHAVHVVAQLHCCVGCSVRCLLRRDAIHAAGACGGTQLLCLLCLPVCCACLPCLCLPFFCPPAWPPSAKTDGSSLHAQPACSLDDHPSGSRAHPTGGLHPACWAGLPSLPAGHRAHFSQRLHLQAVHPAGSASCRQCIPPNHAFSPVPTYRSGPFASNRPLHKPLSSV